MTTMKHTPGPWTTRPGLFFVCKVGNNANDPRVWSEAIPKDGSPFPFGSKEADALLIAAAPELLAALQFVSTDPCFKVLGSVTHDEVRAAIAKATGEK